MTSASKLFYSRRVHFGIRDNTANDTEPDSSALDRYSYRRNATTNGRHHHLNGRNKRQNLDDRNPPPRRIHRHRTSEQGVSQSPPGSIINSEDFRSIRRWQATRNDRLPGVVLLARERLLERLRGSHVSDSRLSSGVHLDDFMYSGYNSFTETNNNLVEETVSETWQAVRMLSPGLSQHALHRLSINVFKKVEENKERSRECSICLEGFEDGDELIDLACMHRFHSCCLFPWVEVCGACPNCRKNIFVTLV